MSCPYSKNPLVHNAPNPTCTHTIWFNSCTDLFATHAVPHKKPGRRERRKRRRRRERDNRRKDEDAACIAISMQGGGMEAKQARFSVRATLKSFVCATSQQGRGAGETNKVFSHLRNTFICATSQQGHRGRRKKQGFPCNLEIFYLRIQPAGQ